MTPAPELPAEENAYAALSRLGSPRSLARSEGDAERAAALRDQVAELLWQRRLQAPLPERSTDLEPPVFKALGEWLELRSWESSQGGLDKEALRYALTALLFGIRSAKDPREYLTWERGLQMRRAGAKSFAEALARAELEEAELAGLAERLNILEELDRRDGLAEALRASYRNGVVVESWQSFAELVDAVNSEKTQVSEALAGTPLERFIFLPNRLRRLGAAMTRSRIAGQDLESRFPELRDDGYFAAALSGNYGIWELGYGSRHRSCNLGSTGPPVPEKIRQAQARLDLRCLRVLVAIRRFHLAEARWPKSLSELRPRFLKDTPTDLDGKAIRYRPERELIYSVGDDQADNDGAEGDRVFSFGLERDD